MSDHDRIAPNFGTMKDFSTYEPSESELEILQVLWEHQPATVRFVFDKIKQKKEVGYTTILKQLQRLYDKNIVERELDGKTHYYRVIPKQEEVQKNLFQRFVDNVYQGSSMKLVMQALGNSQSTPEEIEELQKWIEAQKKK